MISVAIHCWAVKYHQYAVLLRAQLSSIVLNPPQVEVRVVVCADKTDKATVRLLDDFAFRLPRLEILWLDTPEMWCRAIGRNRVALQDTGSDLVWFVDCDYLFGDGCFDTLLDEWGHAGKPTMVWPAGYRTNCDKEEVDIFFQGNADACGLIKPEFAASRDKQSQRAIGGLQIVSGEFAREHGYINTVPKWQLIPSTPFPTMREEAAFRKYMRGIPGTAAVKIGMLPGLYRMRHSEVGYGKNKPQNERNDHEKSNYVKT